MHASLAGQIHDRLALFRECFALCRQGGFSFARFLALAPDRLRLSVGDRGARVRIPTVVDPGLGRAFVEALRVPEAPTARPTGTPALRRWIRLAQVHPEVSPGGLQAFLTRGAEPLLTAGARAYRQAFTEIGRGEGGLEAAYLAHLVLLGTLRRALDEAGAPAWLRAVVAEMWPRAVAEGAQDQADSTPARIGYQTAVTTSLAGLGVALDDWSALPGNPRRTTEDVVRWARRVVQEPIETLPLDRAVDTLARRLLAEPALRTRLGTEILLEQARDAALVLAGEDADPMPARLVADPGYLRQSLLNQRVRRDLTAWLDARSERRAAQVLRGLVDGAPAVAGGDPGPLGVHGGLEARAQLAARGALVAVLEGYTEGLLRDVTGLVAEVDDEAYASGLAYRVSADGSPLYQLRRALAETVLAADLGGILDAAGSHVRRGAGLVARILGPLLRRAEAAPGVVVVARTAEQVILRGGLSELLEIAQATAADVAELQVSFRTDAPAVLGGRPEVETERAEERARLRARLLEIDGAIDTAVPGSEAARLLLDSKALLERQRYLLNAATADPLAGEPPRAALALVRGPPPVPLPGLEEVVFSAAERAARQALARTPWVAGQRRQRRETAAQARGGAELVEPFGVSLRFREGRPALFNGGVVVDDATRLVLERAGAGLEVEDRALSLGDLPDEVRFRYVFDLDPERLRILRARDGRVVHVLRRVGEMNGTDLWELVRPDAPFVAECLG